MNTASLYPAPKGIGLDPAHPVRVYCDGVFDLFHFGHAKLLEYCKKLFPNTAVIVGVTSDEDTIKEKGLIVMKQEERAETVKHCKWADEVICPCPWIVSLVYRRAFCSARWTMGDRVLHFPLGVFKVA